jgi:hypothetical protein
MIFIKLTVDLLVFIVTIPTVEEVIVLLVVKKKVITICIEPHAAISKSCIFFDS